MKLEESYKKVSSALITAKLALIKVSLNPEDPELWGSDVVEALGEIDRAQKHVHTNAIHKIGR